MTVDLVLLHNCLDNCVNLFYRKMVASVIKPSQKSTLIVITVTSLRTVRNRLRSRHHDYAGYLYCLHLVYTHHFSSCLCGSSYWLLVLSTQGLDGYKSGVSQWQATNNPISHSTPAFLHTCNVRQSSFRSSPGREYHPEEPIHDVCAYQESRPKHLPKRDHEGVLCPTRPGWCWFGRH